MTFSMKRLVRLAPALAALVIVLAGSTPAGAQEFRCHQELRDCYGRAAGREGFWEMWAAGLDCELTYIDCVRRALIGR